MYEEARFFTVTGAQVDGTPDSIRERQDALNTVYEEHIAAESSEQPPASPASDSAIGEDVSEGAAETETENTLADEEILERARSAANGVKFQRLWRGETGGYESHSEADMALCSLLAFWTGGDVGQMDRLFRESGMMREKWDEVHYSDESTYGEKTIDRAIAGTDEFYSPDAPADETEAAADSDGSTLVSDAGLARLEAREEERLETVAELQDELQALQAENERLRAELVAEREYVQELEAELKELRSESLLSRIRERLRDSRDTD